MGLGAQDEGPNESEGGAAGFRAVLFFGFFGWLASPQHSSDACSVG